MSPQRDTSRSRFSALVPSVECNPSCVKRRVPIVSWLRNYKSADILPDLIAGITVGLTLIPQSIAYASLAGLEPQYGLYSSFLGSFVYIVFGTVREVNLGPAALLSLLTFNYTHELGAPFAVLLCFLSGIVELLCGLLQLGFLVEFVSTPVVSGFTSAAAVMIASAQVKGLLGLKFDAESFLQTWAAIYNHIGETRQGDALLGAACCLVLLTLKLMKDYVVIGDGKTELTRSQVILSKTLWFVSTARNAIVVLVCAGTAFSFSSSGEGNVPFMLTGRVRSGLPPFQVPAFEARVGNETFSFAQMCAALGSGIVVTPVVAIIGNVAIGKAFANGRILDATQEMMTLGLCNIAGSFVGSMPVTGSFSRSAVSNASGVRTPLAGMYTGIMVILSLSLLTPYFYFIPRATLSSVIMCAVIFMVDIGIILPMWRTNKKDLLAGMVTFIACLVLGMEIGIVTGVAIDLAFLLYANARPKLKIEIVSNLTCPEYILATPTMGLLFPAVDHFRSALQRAVEVDTEEAAPRSLLPIVVDCRNLQKADYTAAQGIQSLIKDLRTRNKVVLFLNLKPSVLRIVSGICTHDFVHAESQEELVILLRGMEKEDVS